MLVLHGAWPVSPRVADDMRPRVSAASGGGVAMTTASIYEANPVNRKRRTNAELAVVDEAIVEAIRADHPVTLRGVYYRVVSAGAVDKTEAGYQLVGRQLLKLRRSGVVPYPWITDGTRWVTRPTTWTGIDETLEDAASSYRRALWHDQPHEVQVFTEKDAISGVILPITERWDVPLGVLRGYASVPFAHSVAQSIIESNKFRSGSTFVYQIGDHDPSGVDAWRDFTEKVTAFIADSYTDAWTHFERLAVTEVQITRWQLPTRPTKRTDTRARGFIGGSVEVDAIPASTLRNLVQKAIVQHIDERQLQITVTYEQSECEIFARMIGGVS
jgi:hypothetical protein